MIRKQVKQTFVAAKPWLGQMHCKNGIRVVNSAGAVVLLAAEVAVAADEDVVAVAVADNEFN